MAKLELKVVGNTPRASLDAAFNPVRSWAITLTSEFGSAALNFQTTDGKVAAAFAYGATLTVDLDTVIAPPKEETP